MEAQGIDFPCKNQLKMQSNFRMDFGRVLASLWDDFSMIFWIIFGGYFDQCLEGPTPRNPRPCAVNQGSERLAGHRKHIAKTTKKSKENWMGISSIFGGIPEIILVYFWLILEEKTHQNIYPKNLSICWSILLGFSIHFGRILDIFWSEKLVKNKDRFSKPFWGAPWKMDPPKRRAAAEARLLVGRW